MAGLTQTRSRVRQTLLFSPEPLCRQLGRKITLASETFQYTGSFKFRGAFHVANNVAETQILAASSGNFGQALAYACQLLGKSCRVVMPETSSKTKIRRVGEYGAEIDLIDTRRLSRAERVEQLKERLPNAYVASPYDDDWVIEGNSTLGEELAALETDMGAIVTPIGGGGLASGIILGLRRAGRSLRVLGAEPAVANDAARSLREGKLVRHEAEPATIADGARTLSLGRRSWEILRQGLSGIVEVPEKTIREAVRLLFLHANIKVEPTGALALAAVLSDPDRFGDESVCCVLSGGNVDPEIYCRILDEEFRGF